MSHGYFPLLGRSRRVQFGGLLVVFLLAFLSHPSYAGNFAVTPIRLDFDQQDRSGAVTIRNMAKDELDVQIVLYEWTQDAQGKDRYQRSDDLLYFPRLAKVGAGESRVVRVGLRQSPTAIQEKQYRLFVEELPDKSAQQGSALAVAIRFGVPLFVAPAEVKRRGVIERLTMEDGALRLKVRNSGNVHFKITTIEASAGDNYSQQVSGWYLLPGVTREFVLEVPQGQCEGLGTVEVKVTADKLELADTIEVSPAMCK